MTWRDWYCLFGIITTVLVMAADDHPTSKGFMGMLIAYTVVFLSWPIWLAGVIRYWIIKSLP